MLKRLMDIVASLIALIAFGPLILVLTCCVKLGSRGPVFFRGQRVGRHGRPFRIFKFRTMVRDADKLGPWNVGDTDPRVTPVGRFLRTTKLDELPQLINVLLGDMTFVGPRPELQYYVDMYTEEEKVILEARPGITDWASITHAEQHIDFTVSDDPDRTYLEKIRPLKLKLQLLYVRNRSVWVDLRILLWTARKLLLKTRRLPREVQLCLAEHRAATDAAEPECRKKAT
jgi:lipopolysaccharide/colanic/teichoic acid biosynthesis glycosyltransferase